MKQELLELLDSRIKHWEDMLDRADGRRRSASANLGVKARESAVYECRRCQTVLLELRNLREEVQQHA